MDETQLRHILANVEDYNLEFKEARNSFNLGKLHDYCAGISNHDIGHLLLGVDNDGNIVGTSAFTGNWNSLAHRLTEHLGVRVQVHQIRTSEGRVLVFNIPKHNPGQPVQVTGGSGDYTYPIRDGESLVEMTPATLQEIFAETDPDWSAEVAHGVTINDLDDRALGEYRRRWANVTNSPEREAISFEQVLTDLSLKRDDGITNAAVLMFGKEGTISRVVPDAD